MKNPLRLLISYRTGSNPVLTTKYNVSKMKATLVKTDVNYLLENDKGTIIASTSLNKDSLKLSKQKCDEIFGVVDVEKLAEEYKNKKGAIPTTELEDEIFKLGFKDGFNKAIELNKDRAFTVEDMHEALHLMNNTSRVEISGEALDIVKKIIEQIDKIIDSIVAKKQLSEIEVKIETETIIETKIIGAIKGVKGSGDKIKTKETTIKLDPEDCLILTRI